jgi:hypothetical protein
MVAKDFPRTLWLLYSYKLLLPLRALLSISPPVNYCNTKLDFYIYLPAMPPKSGPGKKNQQVTPAEKNGLYLRAVEMYQGELAKEDGDPSKQGLRGVCSIISDMYFNETGKTVQLNHQTLANRYKGTPSIIDFNSRKALLSQEEECVVVDFALETESHGFPLSYCHLCEHAEKILCARLGSSFTGVRHHWAEHFVERHHDWLKMCWSHTLDSKQGQAVNLATYKA